MSLPSSRGRHRLTLLTDPVPIGPFLLREPLRRAAKAVRSAFRPQPAYMRSVYRGHAAVTRSAVEGMKKIGVMANYNPQSLGEVAETVVVLARLDAVRQAIQWKRTGRITRLIVGPNIVEFPSDGEALITRPEVDLVITPGPLTCALYEEDCPSLKGRCAAWPAGVDTERWCPAPEMRDRKRVLVYEKQSKGPVGPIDEYVEVLRARGYSVSILQYGNYMPDEYLRELRSASFMVGFVAEESQSLAWSEAWSTDVPTLMWRQDYATFNHVKARGREFRTSTAPYLADASGMFFRNPEEFVEALQYFEEPQRSFRPREWVIANLSDEACAKRLCALAGVDVS